MESSIGWKIDGKEGRFGVRFHDDRKVSLSIFCPCDSDVSTLDEHIPRILGETATALFASEIAERLNKELRPDTAYTTVEIAKHLKAMSDQIAQLPDGRWMLKRLML
jgi:hypothetical protein